MSRGAAGNGGRSKKASVVVGEHGVRGLRDLSTDGLLLLLKQTFREYGHRFPGSTIPAELSDDLEETRTSDFALASFYTYRGLVPVDAVLEAEQRPGDLAPGRRQAQYVFVGPVGRAHRLMIEFQGSDFAVFDSRVRAFKKTAIALRDKDRRRSRL